MNDYRFAEEKKIPVEEVKPICEESLSAIINKTCSMAQDALAMVNKINGHLFGDGNAATNDRSPSCLLDALMITNDKLFEVCYALEMLMKRSGV